MAEHHEYFLMKHREYNAMHRDEMREKAKIHYEANKSEIYERAKAWETTEIDCECGGKYTHQHISHHIKTQKHQQAMEQQQ